MLRIIGRFSSKNLRSKGLRLELTRKYAKEKNIYPTPPPQKPSSGSGVLYTFGAITLVGGATLGYAKYDPQFRKTLVEFVPFTDSAIKFIFLEGNSATGLVSGFYEDLKKSLFGSTIEEGKKPEKKPIVKEIAPYKAPAPMIPTLEDTKKPQEGYTEIRVEQKDKTSEKVEVEIGGDAKIPSNQVSVPETHPSNLAEIEQKFCEAAADAINAYHTATKDLKVYNEDIARIIEGSIDKTDRKLWASIKERTKTKNESIQIAEEKTNEALQNINKLKNLLTKPGYSGSQATKDMVDIEVEKVQNDISNARTNYEIEKRLGGVTEKYWDKVQKARQHFGQELESLFPSIDIGSKKLEINESDVDLLVLHAYSVVLLYQKELARLETIANARLQDALDSAKREGVEPLNKEAICEAIDEEKRRLTLFFQKQCLDLRKESEQELRDQLKRQSQVFADHLEEAVATRAQEIERNLGRRFDEELETLKINYKKQMAAMVGRMKGLDHAFKARDAADKASKQSQVLWAACQALLRAIKTGCPGIPWKDQLRPLSPEIRLVENAAAKGDELVEAVINGIPQEAKERGVFPEDALRERFLKVEEVARRMALVPAEGARLPIYILSYIQSFFLIKNPSPIPQAELNDEAVDYSQLTTHEILQRARYWMDRGDFAQTLKYMNLLEGAPKAIARQWTRETRILLETQQAANTLMAHAASSGLLHL